MNILYAIVLGYFFGYGLGSFVAMNFMGVVCH